jgi:glycosyltransferase involved in cell wall biosynthesis
VRIVLLNQYYAPDSAATAQILSDLGAGLAGAGNEVTAICCKRAYGDPALSYGAREVIDGVRVERTWSTAFGRGSALGRVSDYLTYLLGAAARLAFGKRPDVIVSLSTPPMVAALGHVLARLRRARSIYWVMDVYPDLAFELGVMRPGSFAGRCFRALSEFTLRRSDAVVALGETMGSRLARVRGSEPTVVHNWADGDTIRPRGNEGHALRAEWGWNGRFVVLYSGNMGLAHEFGTVLDAAESLRERSDVGFAFVGSGPRRAEVEARVGERGLANVEFLPYQPRERLGESLTAGDVHLVTLRERMAGLLVPSKIYGILAAGRPTVYVGPDEGEIADILRSGACGTRVAPGDRDGLVAALLRYAEDEELRAAHGRNARRLFEERFTREHGVQAFGRLIESQASRAGQTRAR